MQIHLPQNQLMSMPSKMLMPGKSVWDFLDEGKERECGVEWGFTLLNVITEVIALCFATIIGF